MGIFWKIASVPIYIVTLGVYLPFIIGTLLNALIGIRQIKNTGGE